MTFKIKEGLSVNGNQLSDSERNLSARSLAVNANTSSTTTDTGTLVVTGGAGISENANIGGNVKVGGSFEVTGSTTFGGSLTVGGDLTVNGSTTTINSVTVTVDDKNIELGSVDNPTDSFADGGGITLKGTTNKSITWINSTNRWTSNVGFEAASIQNTPIGSTVSSTGAFTTLTASSTTTISGLLNANAGIAVDTNKFTVADTTGNTSIAGTLSVAGSTTLASVTATSATISGQLTSTVANGTAPFVVTSSTKVDNLNVSLLDGFAASTSNVASTIPVRDANKNLQFSSAILSGSTSGTTTVQASAVASGTLTLPSATDTLVGRDTIDTFTNKSIDLLSNTLTGTLAQFNSALSDADFVSLAGSETLSNKNLLSTSTFFQDTADSTKKAKFDLASIGAGTTRTLTIPNKSGTVALTNDTLDAFAATTSAQLASVITDETGTGSLVFATSPTFSTSLLTNSTSFDLLNTSATTVNFGGAATALTVGATTGTLTLRNPTIVGSNATQNLWNIIATTINFGGAATAVNIGATTGTLTLKNATVVGANTTQNLWNTTTTTINFGGDATSINIGATTGTLTLRNAIVVGSNATQNLWNTTATTINFGGAATAVNIGATTGTTTVRNTLDVNGDLIVDGGDLTTSATTFNLLNTTATTINVGGAATAVNIGASSGTTTVNNNLSVAGDLVVNGTTTTVNSTAVTLDDPIITLGGDTAPTVDDNKDRGVEFRWHNGTTDKVGFFGFDDNTGKFTFIPDAVNTNEVFSGTKGTIDATLEWNDVLNKPDPVVTVTLTGDVTGSGSATLTDLTSGSISFATTIAANSVALGTDTTGNYVASITNGSYITGANGGSEGAALTLAVDATSVNTANKVVARDASGNFSAGTVTVDTLLVDTVLCNTATATTTSTAQFALAAFIASSYTSGEIIIQATQGSSRQITKLLVIHNGTTAYATEFGTIATGLSLFTADVDFNAGNVRLLITPKSATSTSFKAFYTLIGA